MFARTPYSRWLTLQTVTLQSFYHRASSRHPLRLVFVLVPATSIGFRSIARFAFYPDRSADEFRITDTGVGRMYFFTTSCQRPRYKLKYMSLYLSSHKFNIVEQVGSPTLLAAMDRQFGRVPKRQFSIRKSASCKTAPSHLTTILTLGSRAMFCTSRLGADPKWLLCPFNIMGRAHFRFDNHPSTMKFIVAVESQGPCYDVFVSKRRTYQLLVVLWFLQERRNPEKGTLGKTLREIWLGIGEVSIALLSHSPNLDSAFGTVPARIVAAALLIFYMVMSQVSTFGTSSLNHNSLRAVAKPLGFTFGLPPGNTYRHM